MEELTFDQVEVLRFFCLQLLHDYEGPIYDMSYLKFVFTEKDMEAISKYLYSMNRENNKIRLNLRTHIPQEERWIPESRIEEAITILRKTKQAYQEERVEKPIYTPLPIEQVPSDFKAGDRNYPDDNTLDTIYIPIPDAKEFFCLLESIYKQFDSGKNNMNATSLLRTLWLRMGVDDITNVMAFLKRQLDFIKNDYLFSNSESNLKNTETHFRKLPDFSISYVNVANKEWFETNRHIRFLLKRKIGEEIFYDLPIAKYKYYHLPVIHYGLIQEQEKTCYIYGIQNLDITKKDEQIKESLQPEKRYLRNKEVSADFIIVLKLFIELLKEKGIFCIKVPLFQVFNYSFHQKLGNKYEEMLNEYSEEEQKILEQKIEAQEESEEIIRYQNIKKQQERYSKKEDQISQNKTERLLSTFMQVAEKYGDITFLNEPFIESDTLICKIEPQNRKVKHML